MTAQPNNTDRTLLALVPHQSRTTPHTPARAPMNNQEMCDHLVAEFGLSSCSHSLLRNFQREVKTILDTAGRGDDMRDDMQRLTVFGQEMIELYLLCDRDIERTRAEIYREIGYQPIAVASAPMFNPGDRLFDIDVTVIEIPDINVNYQAVGALQTQRHTSTLSTLADEANYYAQAASSYAQANQDIVAARDKAIQQQAIERAARDFAVEQAAYQQTLAKLRANQGI